MPAFSPADADRHLAQYRLGKADPSPAEAEAIRAALMSLVGQADFLTLGVCADSVGARSRVWNGYLAGLDQGLVVEAAGLPVPESGLEGGVYVKFNTRTQKLYGDRYGGGDRGVLVSTQSDYDNRICGTYGHFPLDLWHC
ncbi:MAG: DUF1824 family protein [Synechococcales cyanobacterium RM1_1_8]|nr:DUF1824 family protein [Synechococcales cyanobacterium RM1_1_8]